jgi:hypothetical protein
LGVFCYFVTSIQSKKFVPWPKSFDEWMILRGWRWLQLLPDYGSSTQISFCDRSYVANQWLGVTPASYLLTMLYTHRILRVIDVTQEMIDSEWLTSVTLSVRCKGTTFVPWTNSQNSWLILSASRHLFSHIARKKKSWYRHRGHLKNN